MNKPISIVTKKPIVEPSLLQALKSYRAAVQALIEEGQELQRILRESSTSDDETGGAA